MNRKEQLTSVPILCRITLQNVPYKDYNLLMLTSFEIATVTTMVPKCPPAVMMATCWLLNEVGANIQRMGQMYGSFTLLCT